MKPTFSAKFLRDGSTAIQCRETGERFIIARDWCDQFTLYHNGELARVGSRRSCLIWLEFIAGVNCP